MFALHVDNEKEKKRKDLRVFFLFLFSFSFFLNYSKAMAYKKERIRVCERVVVVALMTKQAKISAFRLNALTNRERDTVHLFTLERSFLY
jgi:hypothetical protein